MRETPQVAVFQQPVRNRAVQLCPVYFTPAGLWKSQATHLLCDIFDILKNVFFSREIPLPWALFIKLENLSLYDYS